MACLGSLSNIARQRPGYMPKVIQSFETLHVNLPPTLAKSQVSSVRKHMKMQLLILLKHPGALEVVSNVSTLLADLGTPDAEIKKHLPKAAENLKRSRPDEEDKNDRGKKKQKKEKQLLPEEDDEGADNKADKSTSVKRTVKTTAVDLLAEELRPLLENGENVANLVLISMVSLPDMMPPQFQSAYTPIAAAGTDSQVKHLARMMANQFSAVGIKPKNEEALKVLEQEEEEDKAVPAAPVEPESSTVKGGIPVVGGQQASEVSTTRKPLRQTPVIIPTGPRRITKFKLTDVTLPLETSVSDAAFLSCINRIIKSKKYAQSGGAAAKRIKILSGLAAQFGGNTSKEYSKSQGYMLQIQDMEENCYNDLLCSFLGSLQKRADQRDGLFYRLVMESPVHTPESIKVIRSFCEDEVHFYAGMHALRELILKRPSMIIRYLQELLELTYHERTEVRSQAIQYVKRLYEREDLKEVIQDFAKQSLGYLLNEKPPLAVIQQLSLDLKAKAAQEGWFEDLIKLCLYLFLALLPVNHKLIHELGVVYVGAPATSKRTVLRVLETPVRGMGMDSPELLLLVENCPKGAETLVTRMLHILTDKAPPTPELVKRVRDLYQKRVSDVRFLIPVLIGLDKKEVVAALPKLIKLNPIVVKEVFHRLLLSHQGDNSVGQSPLSPAELLIALHNIDHTKCDMKSIIKATSLCFNEKNIYTQEVLAVVIQKLMEQTPLPTLLMRTVIQSLAMYPRLSGFVMNILQRLIVKQVWKQPKVWEGFVKCCERTKPQSFNVLIQLPPVHLNAVFDMSQGMREELLEHVKSFTSHQQAHIPRATMKLLETDPVVEAAERQRLERIRAEEATRKALEEKWLGEEQEAKKKLREAESLKRKEEEEKRKLEEEKLIAKRDIEKELQIIEKMKEETKPIISVDSAGVSQIGVVGGGGAPTSSSPPPVEATKSETTANITPEKTESTEQGGRVTRSSSRLQAKNK
ncbi:putative symplekin [Apostichopus japonicus]|uniref:Putative symplekin n=1 Tax=Stichopus japonicus TaxID=307972 RepID=A0A2G8K056_STIJA|nr:putative symplekin [Apostichopus japonicus]